MIHTKKITFIFFVLFVLSTKAFSQFYTGPDLDFAAMSSSTYMSNMNLINANTNYLNAQNRRRKSREAEEVDASSFLFVPNNEVTDQVTQSIIDTLKKRNPNSKIDQALNAKNNPYPNYVKLLKSLGLDVKHNYADAFAAYLLGMWRIANKMNGNPTTEQIHYVKNQVLSTNDVSQWNNQQKQEAADFLIYKLIFANEPYEGSRKSKNLKQLQADSDAVYNRFLQKYKMNLKNMIITENGLTRKS